MVRFTEENIRVSLELSNYRQWFQFCHLALKGNAIFYRNSYTGEKDIEFILSNMYIYEMNYWSVLGNYSLLGGKIAFGRECIGLLRTLLKTNFVRFIVK